MRLLGRWLIVALCVLPFAWPLWWLLSGALRPDLQAPSTTFTPFDWTAMEWGNFGKSAELIPFMQQTLNSLQLVLLAVPITLVIATTAAFGMTQLRPIAQRQLVRLTLLALVMPPTVLWLARFPLFKTIGWLDSLLALLAPALTGGTPLYVLIFYWTFRRIPSDYFEAARLDGATVWQRLRYVALPQSWHIVIGVGMLAFALFWGNYTDPLLYLRSNAEMTLPVGIQTLAQLDITRRPVILAGATLLTLPVLLVFTLGQRLLRRAVAPADQ